MNPEDLEAEIARAREAGRHHGPGASGEDVEGNRALGVGMRIGIEFVSALAVGAGLGWLIDRWLGTKPFGLLILLLLGFAAALANVWRTMSRLGNG